MTIIAEKDLISREISPTTDAEIIAYLRHSCQIAQFTNLAKRDVLVLTTPTTNHMTGLAGDSKATLL